MFNPLLEIYAAMLQRERENEILSLSKEMSWFRKPKLASSPLPNTYLEMILIMFKKENTPKEKFFSPPLQTSTDYCSTCK